MSETSARLLRLLSLLQAHRWGHRPRPSGSGGGPARTWPAASGSPRARSAATWTGCASWATPSTPAPARAGYQLGAGAELPPLLLDDEEAVAVAVGLRSAAGQGIDGIGESSVRALAKLEQVLPHRLRRRVGALNAFTVPLLRGPRLSAIDPGVLTGLANACRDAERLRFEYRDLPQSRTCSTGGPIGAATRRTVEPHRLVCTERRWYLVAWDVDRVGWRTFRVDRVTPTPPHGPRFTPREPPAEDLAAYVSRGVSTTVYASHAVVRLLVPLHEAAELISPSAGTLEAYDEHSCLLRTGAPNLTGTIRTLRDRLSAALDRTGDAASAPGPSGSGAA